MTAATCGRTLPDPPNASGRRRSLLPRAATILGRTVDVRAIAAFLYALANFGAGIGSALV